VRIPRRDFLRKAGTGAAGAVALGACAPGRPDEADGVSEDANRWPKVEWRLATSYPPNLDLLHGAGVRIAERVSELTGGNFSIQAYAAPALAFDTAIPFGLNTRQQISWLHHGGGLELINAVYADFGILAIPALATPGQMGGWFREPLSGLSDLRGLRMRIPGLGGEVMARLGVTVQVLPPSEIYPALERGAIDAAEWVGPYDDERLGFHEIAKNYYYPGWWEPGVTVSCMVNRGAFDELPESYQTVLSVACGETLANRLSVYDAVEPLALQRLVQNHGVILREYPPDIMDAAWRESNAYLEEQAADDAAFRAVYESWKSFRALVFPYAAGNELSYQNAAFPRV